jgi:hypothetical protein
MNQELLRALVGSPNLAADDVLLEALALGDAGEKRAVLRAMGQRATTAGAGRLIRQFQQLPDEVQLMMLEEIGQFHTALRNTAKSDDKDDRIAAMRLILAGRQGRLCFALSENLRSPDTEVAQVAADCLVGLARWVMTETRRLQQNADIDAAAADHARVLRERPDIEQAVARAADGLRGSQAPDLIRAALLLADHTASPTLAILTTPRHAAQGPMLRRLSEPPESEYVDAFLLAGAVGGLRGVFAHVMSHINVSTTLDAIARRTYWLRDHRMAVSVAGFSRGAWLDQSILAADLARRPQEELGSIAEWVCRSGAHEAIQDERMHQLIGAARSPECRLPILRAALVRQGMSTEILLALAQDTDEMIARTAVREIVRRRPVDSEAMLLPLLSTAAPTVRQVISRAIGQRTFNNYWDRFERLSPKMRLSAGRALLRLLPDATQRLGRKIISGDLAAKMRGLQIVQELSCAQPLREVVSAMTSHGDAKIRSKAVLLLSQLTSPPPGVLVDRALGDTDSRVRSNAIEVLEHQSQADYVPLLTERTKSPVSRERANAIKALATMQVSLASPALVAMLRDPRSDHRVSGLWVLRQVGMWKILAEVARLARTDENLRVRRYAQAIIQSLAVNKPAPASRNTPLDKAI